MFEVIFLQFLNGLDKGAAYALIALGLTLVFGTLGVVNFAHGALFMLGAFCAVLFRQILTLETVTIDPEQLSPWGQPLEIREPLVQAWFGDFGAVLVNYSVPFSIIITIPIMLVIGVALERGIIKHFYKRPHAEQILVTFGLAIVAQEVIKSFFGPNPIPQPMPTDLRGAADIGAFLGMQANVITYPIWRLIYFLFSAVIIGGVFAFLQFTTFGMVVRAGMADRETVGLLGINIDKRFTIMFGLAAVVAGVAGAELSHRHGLPGAQLRGGGGGRHGLPARRRGGRLPARHPAELCLNDPGQGRLPRHRPDHHLSRRRRHSTGFAAWPVWSPRRDGGLICWPCPATISCCLSAFRWSC